VVGAVIEHRARLARWTVAAGRAGHPFSYAATGRWFGPWGLPRTIHRGPGAGRYACAAANAGVAAMSARGCLLVPAARACCCSLG